MGKHRGATHDAMLALWHQAVFEAHRANVINAQDGICFHE